MALRIVITDLAGNVTAHVRQFSDAKVTIDNNGDRTAEVTVPGEDPCAAEGLKVLERMLKVYYAPPLRSNATLVFWGQIDTPEWKGDRVTIAAKGLASTRLSHAYLSSSFVPIFGDPPAIDSDGQAIGLVPISATGIRRLLNAAEPRDGVGWRNHIVDGVVTHPGAYPRAVLSTGYASGTRVRTGDTIGFPDPAIVPAASCVIEWPNATTSIYNKVYDDGFRLVTATAPWPAGTVAKLSAPQRLKVGPGQDDIWSIVQQVVSHPLGPDIDLAPTDDFVNPVGGVVHPGGDERNAMAAIPDADDDTGAAGQVESTVHVADTGAISSVVLSLFVTHGFTGDLTVDLVHPNGTTTVRVFDGPAAADGGQNLGRGEAERLVLDDSAATSVEAAVAIDWLGGDRSGLSGSWKPNHPLSGFAGLAMAGDWTLRVRDTANGDTGTLRAWGLSFNGAAAQQRELAYAKMHVYDALETEVGGSRDKRRTVVLQAGWGARDVPLDSVSVKPGGDQTRNFAIRVTQGSGAEGSGVTQIARAQNKHSRQRYGTYTDWQSASTQDYLSVADVLKALAQAVILAHGVPATYVDFDLRTDAGARLFFPDDFKQGEVVTLDVRYGELRASVPSFINTVTLTQEGQTGEARVTLTVVPDTQAGSDTGTPAAP